MFPCFVSDKAFAGKIVLYIYDRFAQQFFKSFFIRFKCNPSMYKYSEIGPYLMNIFNLVMVNHHLHAHLAPGGNAHYVSNIPFFGMFYNLIQFLVPVFDSSDTTSRFIKSLKPEGAFFC